MSHLGFGTVWPAGTVCVGSAGNDLGGRDSAAKPLHADAIFIDDYPKRATEFGPALPAPARSAMNFCCGPFDWHGRVVSMFGRLMGSAPKVDLVVQTTEMPGHAGVDVEAEVHVDYTSGRDYTCVFVAVDISPLQAKYDAKVQQCANLEVERDELRAALEGARREAERAQIELAGAQKLLAACSGALARAQRALRVIKSLADENDAILDTVALGLEAPPQYTA